MASNYTVKTHISYAIACFNKIDNVYKILYVRRRTSYYLALIFTTKYNTKYLSKLEHYINNLPFLEKQDLLTLSFNDLWNKYFNFYSHYSYMYDNQNLNQTLQKTEVQRRYEFLYNSNITATYLKMLANSSSKPLPFSLPKGRKNGNENPLDAAIREFEEETNFKKEDYKLMMHIKPYTDSFIDCNVRYTTIIYFAESTQMPSLKLMNIVQSSEVSEIKYLAKKELEIFEQDHLLELHDKLKRKYLNNSRHVAV